MITMSIPHLRHHREGGYLWNSSWTFVNVVNGHDIWLISYALVHTNWKRIPLLHFAHYMYSWFDPAGWVTANSFDLCSLWSNISNIGIIVSSTGCLIWIATKVKKWLGFMPGNLKWQVSSPPKTWPYHCFTFLAIHIRHPIPTIFKRYSPHRSTTDL